jgi:PIN domain nuclease of toxin-antitoxin system
VGEVKVLLDTHVFLWSKSNDSRMSSTAWSLLRDPANQLYLSAASVAEIAIKVGIGKMSLDVPIDLFQKGWRMARSMRCRFV